MIAVNQVTTLGWDLPEALGRYAEHGFEGVGLFRRKVDDCGIDAAVDAVHSGGLKVTSLGMAGGFTGSDVLSYDQAIDDGIDAIEHAMRLGAGNVIVIAGGRNGHTLTHARRSVVRGLRELAEVAEGCGVRVLLEPVAEGCGEYWSFINTLSDALDIVHRVKRSALGLVCDLYHVGLSSQEADIWDRAAEHIGLVQLADGRGSPMGETNRCLLGDGCVPLSDMLERILNNGFTGPIEVEVYGEDVESLSPDAVLDHSRRYIDHLFGAVGVR